jgi:predicted nucleic acid-binding protein
MAAEERVFFDLNIILDVLQIRQPFYEDSARLLAYAEKGQIQGWIAAHSVTTLFYLISKDQSADQARVVLTRLLQFLHIAAVDQSVIEQSLNLPYRDFEDAVQAMAAVQIKAAYLVTRNIKDYQPALLPVIQPADLLIILSSPKLI